jgi:predicted transcriptional regulator
MTDSLHDRFSRRERQIMDAVYALGEATAAEVVERLGEPSAYDSVRVTLGILEKKGYVDHRVDGPRNVYYPTVPAEEAQQSAMSHLVSTFFGGSPSRAILAFLDMTESKLTRKELEEIAEWVEKAGEDT